MTDSTPHGFHSTGAGRPGDRPGRVGRAARRARARRAAARSAVEERLRVVPWWAWLTLFVGLVLRCSRSSSTSGYVRRVAFDTVLYMLLALGLNVVVGWGGLLDLGYVAFYGIGAYAYALLDSRPATASTCRRSSSIPIVVDHRRRSSGFLVGLPSRRLTGDYLAIVTLFFLQLFLTVTTNGDNVFGHNVTGGAERDPQRRPVRASSGTSSASQHDGVFAVVVPLRRARVLRRRLRRAAISSTTRAPAAPGARCARTRSPPR